MGDVVKFSGGGAVADLKQLSTAISNVAQSAEPLATGEPILRLLKDGIWVYGQENIEYQEGALVAFNPVSLQHGFISWGDAEILGEVMVPLTQPKPSRGSLQDTGARWDEQYAINGVIMTGEDEGTELIYKPTSLGGKRAFKELLDKIVQRLEKGEPAVPMIELEVDHYIHKKYGKTYIPILNVKKWATLDGEIEDSPKPKAEAAPAEKSEPAKEEGPKRRRRRTPAA